MEKYITVIGTMEGLYNIVLCDENGVIQTLQNGFQKLDNAKKYAEILVNIYKVKYKDVKFDWLK